MMKQFFNLLGACESATHTVYIQNMGALFDGPVPQCRKARNAFGCNVHVNLKICLCSIIKGINVHLAKKMIEDRSRDYMNARRVAKVSSEWYKKDLALFWSSMHF